MVRFLRDVGGLPSLTDSGDGFLGLDSFGDRLFSWNVGSLLYRLGNPPLKFVHAFPHGRRNDDRLSSFVELLLSECGLPFHRKDEGEIHLGFGQATSRFAEGGESLGRATGSSEQEAKVVVRSLMPRIGGESALVLCRCLLPFALHVKTVSVITADVGVFGINEQPFLEVPRGLLKLSPAVGDYGKAMCREGVSRILLQGALIDRLRSGQFPFFLQRSSLSDGEVLNEIGVRIF